MKPFGKLVTLVKSPSFLIGSGIAGMIFSTVLAVKATPKVTKLLEEKKPETKMETVKVAAPHYIPAMVTCGLSITCILWGNAKHIRRNAALAAAYSLSETTLKDYKKTVDNLLSDKKAKEIHETVGKEKLDRNPLSKTNEVIITRKGDTLCYDAVSGRYFKSDIETIRQAINELNKRLMVEMYIPLNDLYYELNLERIKLGDDLGWNVEEGLIECAFSSQLADDGQPCLVMDFHVDPRTDYKTLF